MKIYSLFYIDNDDNIEWGTAGSVQLIGTFTSQEKIHEYLIKQYQKDHPDTKQVPTNLKTLLGGHRYNFLNNYQIRTTTLNQPTNSEITSWWYEE